MVAKANAQPVLRQKIRQAIEDMTGEFTDDQVLMMATAMMSPDELRASTYEAQMALVKQEIRNSTKLPPSTNGELWPRPIDSYLNSVINLGDGGHIKIADSKWPHQQLRREHELKNMRRVNRSFELNEQRRETLKPHMESGELTTFEALERLNALESDKE